MPGVVGGEGSREPSPIPIGDKKMNRTQPIAALILLVCLISGCMFWWSPSPSLKNDPLTKVEIVWYANADSTNPVPHQFTVTTNSDLADIQSDFKVNSWEPMTLKFPVYPPETKLHLHTTKGHVWELSPKTTTYIHDVKDPGWSGKAQISKSFVKAINKLIEKEKQSPKPSTATE